MVQYDYLTWYNLKNIKRDFIFKFDQRTRKFAATRSRCGYVSKY